MGCTSCHGDGGIPDGRWVCTAFTQQQQQANTGAAVQELNTSTGCVETAPLLAAERERERDLQTQPRRCLCTPRSATVCAIFYERLPRVGSNYMQSERNIPHTYLRHDVGKGEVDTPQPYPAEPDRLLGTGDVGHRLGAAQAGGETETARNRAQQVHVNKLKQNNCVLLPNLLGAWFEYWKMQRYFDVVEK